MDGLVVIFVDIYEWYYSNGGAWSVYYKAERLVDGGNVVKMAGYLYRWREAPKLWERYIIGRV